MCVNRYGIVSCVKCVGDTGDRAYEFWNGEFKLGTLIIGDEGATYLPETSPKPVSYTRAQGLMELKQALASMKVVKVQ